jgi:hypothetical protein
MCSVAVCQGWLAQYTEAFAGGMCLVMGVGKPTLRILSTAEFVGMPQFPSGHGRGSALKMLGDAEPRPIEFSPRFDSFLVGRFS